MNLENVSYSSFEVTAFQFETEKKSPDFLNNFEKVGNTGNCIKVAWFDMEIRTG